MPASWIQLKLCSGDDIAALLLREQQNRSDAAQQMDGLGQAERARALREAAVLIDRYRHDGSRAR